MHRRQRDLLELIYAEPHVDAHKLVYADWLLGRGNPRGELIMLQLRREAEGLSRAEAERERALLHKYGKRWLGELAPMIEPESAVFRKGFLSECIGREVSGLFARPQRILKNPAWATLEKLGGYLGILESPWLSSLWSLGPTTLQSLATCPLPCLPRIRALRIMLPEHGNGYGRDMLPATELLHAQLPSRFPDLRDVALCHQDRFVDLYQPPYDEDDENRMRFDPESYAPALTEALMGSIDTLTICARVSMSHRAWEQWSLPRPDIATWLERCRPSAHPRRITLEPYHGWRFTLERLEQAWTLHIDWNLLAASSDIKAAELSLSTLHGGRSPIFPRITVAVTGHARPALRQALSALLTPLGPVAFLDETAR